MNEDDLSERPDTIQLQESPEYDTDENEHGEVENLEFQNSLCENNVVASTPVSKGNTSSASSFKKADFDPVEFMSEPSEDVFFELKKDELISSAKHLLLEVRKSM